MANILSTLVKKLSTTNKNPVTRSNAPYKEYGATGIEMYSGWITSEEYVSNLLGTKGTAVYDQMRRGDAQVRGVLYAIMLPIREASWYVQSVSDDSKDVEIAECIERNFFDLMIITWDDFLRQALSFLTFGFSLFEKVYAPPSERSQGKIYLAKLAPRIQKSLYKWYRKNHGEFDGIQQYTQIGDTFDYVDIPASKLVLFVNDQEGSNFEGISVLRSAYKNWYIKDKLIKIDAIAHDRFASGIPWVKPAEGANDDDITRASAILQDLYSREKSYMVVPPNFELGIFEKNSSNSSIIDSIRYHDEEISKNVLAQFINLGSTSTGSRALGETFEQLFVNSLNSYADYICDIMNRVVIPEIVDYNYNGIIDYPKLDHSKIVLNVGNYLESLSKVGLTNVLTTDLETENHIRSMTGLPEKMEVEIDEQDNIQSTPSDNTPANKVEPSNEEVEDESTDNQQASLDGDSYKLTRQRRRKLNEAEERVVDVDGIEFALDDGVSKWEKQIIKVRRQQVAQLSEDVVSKSPEDLKAAFVGKLADRIYTEMKKNFKRGKQDVRNELKRQGDMLKQKKLQDELETIDDYQDEEEVIPFLKDKAKADATMMSNNLVNASLFAFYGMSQEGKTKEDISKAVKKSLNDNNLSKVRQYAESSVSAAYGMGREVQAKTSENLIQSAIYSAILDGQTCLECLPKDQVEHDLNDSNFYTPNPSCLGGGKCRCINIYVRKGVDFEYFEPKTMSEYRADEKKTNAAQKEMDKMDTTSPDYEWGTKQKIKDDLLQEAREEQ